MSSALGDRQGAAYKQNSPRPTRMHPTHPWEGKGQQKHCKEQAWRPWAADTGLLCAQGPASTPTPAHLPTPIQAKDIAAARWPDGLTDTSCQGGKEQGPGRSVGKGQIPMSIIEPA